MWQRRCAGQGYIQAFSFGPLINGSFGAVSAAFPKLPYASGRPGCRSVPPALNLLRQVLPDSATALLASATRQKRPTAKTVGKATYGSPPGTRRFGRLAARPGPNEDLSPRYLCYIARPPRAQDMVVHPVPGVVHELAYSDFDCRGADHPFMPQTPRQSWTRPGRI